MEDQPTVHVPTEDLLVGEDNSDAERKGSDPTTATTRTDDDAPPTAQDLSRMFQHMLMDHDHGGDSRYPIASLVVDPDKPWREKLPSVKTFAATITSPPRGQRSGCGLDLSTSTPSVTGIIIPSVNPSGTTVPTKTMTILLSHQFHGWHAIVGHTIGVHERSSY